VLYHTNKPVVFIDYDYDTSWVYHVLCNMYNITCPVVFVLELTSMHQGVYVCHVLFSSALNSSFFVWVLVWLMRNSKYMELGTDSTLDYMFDIIHDSSVLYG